MELPKLFASFGIALMLVIFLNGALSTFYKPPQEGGYSDCYQYSSDCYSLGYNTPEYTACRDAQDLQMDQCIEDSLSQVKTYQTIYYMILAILAVGLLIFGFSIIHYQTIGSGFIGASVLLLIFASLFAIISGFTSSLIGGITSMMTGYSVSSTGGTSTLSYLNIIFSLIGLGLLIWFSYVKLDKE